MYRHDDNNAHRITATVMNPEEAPKLSLGNDIQTPHQIAAQGFETLARAHSDHSYQPKERDVTYNDGETYPLPPYFSIY